MVGTFNLPDVGEGLTEAEVMSWKVAVGDVVEVNDVVVEIETAKSAVELPIPFAGEVRELLADEGDTLEVGSPLIRIAEAGSPDAPAAPEEDAVAAGQQNAAAEGVPEQGADSSADSSGDSTQQGALVGSGPKADASHRTGPGGGARARQPSGRAAPGWARRRAGQSGGRYSGAHQPSRPSAGPQAGGGAAGAWHR